MTRDREQNRAAIIAAWIIIAIGAGVLVRSFAQGANGAGQLNPLGIRLVAPTTFIPNSPGSVRVIVTDHSRARPAAGAKVTVRLTNGEGTQGHVLVSAKANNAGTIDARFTVPALQPGTYKLRVEAAYKGHSDEVAQDVELRDAFRLMMVTDKPLYQPGQTIHMRALALREPDLQPVAGKQILFEVRDPKGNKVFKKRAKTTDLGAAWADFTLADEINLGRYECTATLAETQATKTVTVKRYVLPKFKVTAETDRPFYLPSQTLKGTVSAQYFFGKPVAGAKVEITAKTFDVEYTEIAKVTGKTDKSGRFEFEIKLPSHFVGQPLEQGKAFVQLDIKVTDTAEHTEKITVSRSVAAQELEIHAVPESGELVPNVENRVWVLVSDPTGKPVKATVRLRDTQAQEPWLVTWQRQRVETDDLGIAEIVITPKLPPDRGVAGPAGGPTVMRRPMVLDLPREAPDAEPGGPISLELSAKAANGARAKQVVSLPAGELSDGESLLLRVSRVLAKVGQTITATALAPAGRGYVYFDVVKSRQTMLTRAANLSRGRATARISLGPELAGTIYISAYRITRRGNVVRDTVPVIVEPASDLKIEVKPDRNTYRPGQQARVGFAVRTAKGKPVVAALGVSIVDESVFALQEMQPGMEKVYAYLEEELRKPRYEIHGLELPVIIARPKPEFTAAQEKAARVMLASAELPRLNFRVVDSYKPRLEKAKAEWAKKMRPKLNVVRRAVERWMRAHNRTLKAPNAAKTLLEAGLLKKQDLEDLWGRQMKIVSPWGAEEIYEPALLSAGPDGKWDTEDDVLVAPRMDMIRGRGIMMLGAKMAMPAAAPPGAVGAPAAEMAAEGGMGGAPPGTKKPVRIRQFFPETLLFKPDLITDDRGRATLEFKMADSITTWRLTALANSAGGLLGSTDAPLRCFQDFFVDIDLPVSLTQGDEISIPVAVYNYLKDPQTVTLRLEKEDWFELRGSAEQKLDLKPNEVTVRYFPIKALKLGEHKLTVMAYGTKMSDAIRRSVRVVPDGKLTETTIAGRLKDQIETTVTIPKSAIAGASTILVKVYPGIFTQAVEGLDSILRMPFGCFEQTTSITYPNVLVLDYMRSTKQVTPEIQMKAEGYINLGYQRLLSYEVEGGGFSWFGDPPANKLLTALGLMEFYDMNNVYAIDEAVIARTRQWLLDQQEDDGSWKPDKEYLHQETWRRLQNSRLLPTAYITWALCSAGSKAPRTRRGYEWVRENWQDAADAYQLAVVCNALVAGDNAFNSGNLDDTTVEALDKLISMAKREDDKMWWETKMTGLTHSRGNGADLEATGFAAIALIASGRYSAEATQVLNYLIAAKDPGGTWHTTQATVLALKALLMAQKGATQKIRGTVVVTVNGKQAARFDITPDNADVLRMADCRDLVKPGANKVKISLQGEGSMLYQVVGKYWLPWSQVRREGRELLDISVQYDKTKLAVNDTVTAKVSIKNNAPGRTSMIVVDLGIPPGFTVQSPDLAEWVDQGVIQKFNLTGRQIIVYIEKLDAGQVVEFDYRLKARYPIKAKAPAATAYEYYNPDNRAEAEPVEMVVH